MGSPKASRNAKNTLKTAMDKRLLGGEAAKTMVKTGA